LLGTIQSGVFDMAKKQAERDIRIEYPSRNTIDGSYKAKWGVYEYVTHEDGTVDRRFLQEFDQRDVAIEAYPNATFKPSGYKSQE
jgi:hypothetical protein